MTQPQTEQEAPAPNLAKRTRELAQGLSHIPEEAVAPIPAPIAPIPAPIVPAVPDGKIAWGAGEGWLAEYERMAMRVAASVALPTGIRGDPRNVLAVALAGRELGIGFMEATRQIDVIQGATALRSELKMALARRDGLIVDEVIETETSCTIKAHRKDTGEKGEASFTEADKKLAGLGRDANSNWAKYPRDMYFARASARLIRRLMPDARGATFKSVEELTEVSDVRD